LSEPASVRLQKYLSRAGVASRREAERMMLAGRVSVNGTVVRELGVRVVPGVDDVRLDDQRVSPAPTRWIAYHKPPAVLTTRSDPHGGRTIYDDLPDAAAGLRYLGRLDRDAEGLILLTNAGDLAHALQHPSGEIEREYWLEVAGAVTPAERRTLLAGVALEDGPARAERVHLGGGDGVRSTLTLVITEGRKREVRRMMAAIGHPVLRLRRVRFGPIELGDLPRGGWRELEADEVDALVRAGGQL
jgi:23S rRNA pseudouridine2605 synthase